MTESAIGGITLTNSTTTGGITLTNSTPFVTFNAEFAREVTYLQLLEESTKRALQTKRLTTKPTNPTAMLFFAKEQFLSHPNVYHCCTSVRHFSLSEPTRSTLRSLRFFKIYLYIIFPSKSSSSKWSHAYRFPNQHTLRTVTQSNTPRGWST